MTTTRKQIEIVRNGLIFIEQHKAALIGRECTSDEYEAAIKTAFTALSKLSEMFLVNSEQESIQAISSEEKAGQYFKWLTETEVERISEPRSEWIRFLIERFWDSCSKSDEEFIDALRDLVKISKPPPVKKLGKSNRKET